jgi:hypothetical protein
MGSGPNAENSGQNTERFFPERHESVRESTAPFGQLAVRQVANFPSFAEPADGNSISASPRHVAVGGLVRDVESHSVRQSVELGPGSFE